MRIWFLLGLLIAAPAAADDEATLAKIYAPDFSGATANGTEVRREALFAIFRRAHEHGALTADSTILTAREIGGAVVVTGPL